MKIQASKVRYKGICITLVYSNLTKPQKVIILAYGLPGEPPYYKKPFMMKIIPHPKYVISYDFQHAEKENFFF